MTTVLWSSPSIFQLCFGIEEDPVSYQELDTRECFCAHLP